MKFTYNSRVISIISNNGTEQKHMFPFWRQHKHKLDYFLKGSFVQIHSHAIKLDNKYSHLYVTNILYIVYTRQWIHHYPDHPVRSVNNFLSKFLIMNYQWKT